VYGGGDRKKQVKAVMSGVEIIVATPGRFNDLLECQIISLESVTYLVSLLLYYSILKTDA